MKSTYTSYDFESSRGRVDDILKATDAEFEELNSIPSRDRLTFTNGFYVNCTALFVDIRKSSELPKKHKHPTLAKIYRSYISEVTAIINSDDDCTEVTIAGDSIWGIFDTPWQYQIDNVISIAAKISSVVDMLNCKFKNKNIDPITIGIGVDYGKALMVKAGFKGSTINDVVWMGDVVNSASNLCHYGNQNYYDRETMISSVIYSNMNDHMKGLFSYNNTRQCYHGNIVNTVMDEWVKANC
jgi:class 3 adenylate cyclase